MKCKLMKIWGLVSSGNSLSHGQEKNVEEVLTVGGNSTVRMKQCGKILTLIAKFGTDISRKVILLNVSYIGILVTYQRYVCAQNYAFCSFLQPTVPLEMDNF